MKKLDTFFIAEINRTFKNSVENAAAVFNFEFLFYKNSCIDCCFSFHCETAFSATKNLKLFCY